MVFDWRYSYFDTRIVRRSNALFADLTNQPYGKELCFQDTGLVNSASPPFGDKKSIATWRFQIFLIFTLLLGEYDPM